MTYTNINGYLVPNLILPEPVKRFGRYGQMRAKYLEEHRHLLHDRLLLEGTLNRHLAEVDVAAKMRLPFRMTAATTRTVFILTRPYPTTSLFVFRKYFAGIG